MALICKYPLRSVAPVKVFHTGSSPKVDMGPSWQGRIEGQVSCALVGRL